MTLLTIDEVAERLKCSDDQVRVLIRNNELQYVNIGSGKHRMCLRVTEEALLEFLQGRGSQKPQPRRKPQPKPQKEWV